MNTSGKFTLLSLKSQQSIATWYLAEIWKQDIREADRENKTAWRVVEYSFNASTGAEAEV